MRLTFEDRLKMCEDHVLRGKSLSHISEDNWNYDITNLKYLINLYKKFGELMNRFERTKEKHENLIKSRNIKKSQAIN